MGTYKVTEQGNVDTQFNLAKCYDNEEGVMKYEENAVNCYSKTAKRGKNNAPRENYLWKKVK